MDGKITLSPKHGLNPSLGLCYYCNEEDGTVVLPGKSRRGDEESPRKAVWSLDPCKKCGDYMKQGVILISVRDGETKTKNPYRTGKWVVIKESGVDRLPIHHEVIKRLLQSRYSFVEDTVWAALGLPIGAGKQDQGAD